MKVLIVDDSLLANHALKSYFTKLGHDVVGVAKSGEEAKKIFSGSKPELVSVDSVMPGISGADFIKFVNEADKKSGKKTHILMVSSDDVSEEDKNRIKVDKYLIKPITLEKIKAAIASL